VSYGIAHVVRGDFNERLYYPLNTVLEDLSSTRDTIRARCEITAAGGRERGRPAGRGGVTRDQGFSPSTRWGCSRTGPAEE
jgi:hypothetical protein